MNGAPSRSRASSSWSTASSGTSASTARGPRPPGPAGFYTAEDLEALHDEYVALLHKYGHSAQDAPPGARPMQLRMFYIPDE